MRFSTLALGLLTLGTVSLLTPFAAHAQTVYNTLASFEAATNGLTDVNFNGIVAPGSYANYGVPLGYTSPQGINFTFANPPVFEDINITSSTYYGPGTYQNDFLIQAANVPGSPTWQITLPTPVTAVGLDLGTFNGGPYQYSFSNGDTYLEPTTESFGSTSFIGFTFTSPITSLDFVSTIGDIAVVDDFKFGNSTSVPEPGAYALLGSLGLTVVGFLRRRRAR